ncbi:hypothetical protein NDU88_000860 [Pleurodeles waltl]|uniref:Uncharacterized protein n=1 Tax=Pleurodeles waltl TaxID=8319 RepID=A0AAV7LZC6_PLEWA|nr:hypothetical protein NDU88_000860 [Pleurodeles waltl]
MIPQDQQATPALVGPLTSATPQEVVRSGQIPIQIAPGRVVMPTTNGLPVVPAVAAINWSVAQHDIVEHLASIIPWFLEVGMLSPSLVSGPLAGSSGEDVMEKAQRLVSHLHTSKRGQDSQGGVRSDRVKETHSPALACLAAPAIAAQQPAKASAEASTSVASSVSQSAADSDQAIQMLRELGPGALMAKSDIESAFRLLPVHPDDFNLLGFQFEGRFYFDKCMPMG